MLDEGPAPPNSGLGRSIRVALVIAVCLSFVNLGEAAGAGISCPTTTTVSTPGMPVVCRTVVRLGPTTLRSIGRIVKQQAAMFGERHPTHVGVVITTRSAATTLTGSVVSGDFAIYFVQARGHFTCGSLCFGPSGASPPTGNYLTLGLGTDKLEIEDFGIAPQAVDLHRLGRVSSVPLA